MSLVDVGIRRVGSNDGLVQQKHRHSATERLTVKLGQCGVAETSLPCHNYVNIEHAYMRHFLAKKHR